MHLQQTCHPRFIHSLPWTDVHAHTGTDISLHYSQHKFCWCAARRQQALGVQLSRLKTLLAVCGTSLPCLSPACQHMLEITPMPGLQARLSRLCFTYAAWQIGSPMFAGGHSAGTSGSVLGSQARPEDTASSPPRPGSAKLSGVPMPQVRPALAHDACSTLPLPWPQGTVMHACQHR